MTEETTDKTSQDVGTDAVDEPVDTEAEAAEEPAAEEAEAAEEPAAEEAEAAEEPAAEEAEAVEEPAVEEAEAVEEPAAEEKEEPEEVEGEAEEEPEEDEGEAEEEPEEEKLPGMNWYVLRVQSNKEDSVREALEKRIKVAGLDKQIIRVLVPTEKVSEIKSGRKRVTERKIYPGYVMVEMVMNDDTWYLVRETPGIGDFVGGAPNTRPMPMPQKEVDKMLGEADKVEEDQPRLDIKFREGEAVKITEGPFENFSGVVQEVVASKGLVKVEVTIFGRPTPVELEYWQIESI